MSTQKHILIAEDDPHLSFLLKNNLEQEDYRVTCCKDGSQAWSAFMTGHTDLCILDVMMPKQDGFSLANMIRNRNSAVPILFLTARNQKEDVYKGFESGADDYITKPFTIKELLFRIKAILKRAANMAPQTNEGSYKVGKLLFNHTTRELYCGEQVKKLSTKENELLRIFCESRNMVVNRTRLLLEVWGNDDYFVSKSLDVYITRLRKLLSDDPDISIQNYHSVGYKLIERTNITTMQ